jgi:hypothetical protein
MDLTLRTRQKSMPAPPAQRAASAPILLVAAATVAAAILVAENANRSCWKQAPSIFSPSHSTARP